METACLVSPLDELRRLETRAGGLKAYIPPFEVEDLCVLIEDGGRLLSTTFSAQLKVHVGGTMEHVVGGGATVFHALQEALFKALLSHFPQLKDKNGVMNVKITRHEVQIPYIPEDGPQKPIDRARVLIQLEDGQMGWCVQGVADDPFIAYWLALKFGLEWWLMRDK